MPTIVSRDRAGRQPDHAPHRRSASTPRRSAWRRSRSPPPRPPTMAAPRHRAATSPARGVPAAVHRRPRRRRHRRGHPVRGPAPRRTPCSCWSTSAPTPRSCSATATASSPRPAPPGPRSRARSSAVASAPRPAPSSGCASIRVTLEPRFRVIGSDLWSDEPGFAESTAELDITGICGSGIIEVIAEMFLAGVIDTDGVVQGALAERSPRVVARRAARSATSSIRQPTGSVRAAHHPERRARASSWPRARCAPASSC